MARGVAIGLLVVGAIALFLLWPFGEQQPNAAGLYLEFTGGFDNEVEITIDGDIVFKGKVKTGDITNPAPKIWHTTFVGKTLKTKVAVQISSFTKEYSNYNLSVKMEKPEVWILISRGEENMNKWISFEISYERPVR